MTFDKKFDFVLLIGVLEYAARFTHTQNPQTDFLNKCKSFLKPDGTLIIAIENQLGIEYWSGKPEDHTTILFDGIMDYPEPKGIKTFSRLELKNLLNSCGFVDQKFFYPYPDYKFPYIIHSDEMLPSPTELNRFRNNFYDIDRLELFQMDLALPTIIKAGMYPDMANSFLVLARQTHEKQRVFPLKIASNIGFRKAKYRLRSEIYRTQSGFIVKKVARTPEARAHLCAMTENCPYLTKIYGANHVAQMKLITEDAALMEFIAGMSFDEYLFKILEQRGVDEFKKIFYSYLENFLRGAEDDMKFDDAVLSFDAPNRKYDLDATLHNTMVRDNNLVIFDYEFLLPTLPKKFIMWRACKNFWSFHQKSFSKYEFTLEKLLAPLNLSKDMLKEYKLWDSITSKLFSDTQLDRYKKRRLKVQGINFS